MTDGLGSVVASFSNTEGLAAVLGNQTYEPYGKARYQQGNRGTSKGYAGQYNDTLSGLDYYGARYYDPVAGVFLSPDSVQGNAQGMDPYAYVSGNPETYVDPTGHVMEIPGMGGGDGEIQGEGDFSEGDASYVEPTDVSINYEVDSNILQQEEQGLNNEGTPAEQVNLEQDQRQMEQKLREEEQQGENQPTQPTQPENPSQPAEPDNPSQPSNTGNGDITNAPTHEPTNQPSEGDPFTPPENGNYNEAANSLAQTVYSEIQATGVNMTHVDVSVGFTDNGLTLVSVDQRWIDAGATSIEDDVANAAQSVKQNLLGDQGMYVGPTQLIYRRSGWIEAQHAEDYIMDAVSHLDTDLIGIGSFPLEVCRVCENRIIPVYPALEPGINSFH
jgi:RHS repeat-associated protein